MSRATHCVGGVRPSPPGGQVGDRRPYYSTPCPSEWLVPAARSQLESWISDESSLSRIKHAGADDSTSLSSSRADSPRFSLSSLLLPPAGARLLLLTCRVADTGVTYPCLYLPLPGYLPAFPVSDPAFSSTACISEKTRVL